MKFTLWDSKFFQAMILHDKAQILLDSEQFEELFSAIRNAISITIKTEKISPLFLLRKKIMLLSSLKIHAQAIRKIYDNPEYYIDAIDFHRNVMRNMEGMKPSDLLFDCVLMTADMLSIAGIRVDEKYFYDSVYYLEWSEKIDEATQKFKYKARVLASKGKFFKLMYDKNRDPTHLNLGIENFEEAYSLFLKEKKERFMADVAANLGCMYFDRSLINSSAVDREKSIMYLVKASEILQKSGQSKQLSDIQALLGVSISDRRYGYEHKNREVSLTYNINLLESLSLEVQPTEWLMAACNLFKSFSQDGTLRTFLLEREDWCFDMLKKMSQASESIGDTDTAYLYLTSRQQVLSAIGKYSVVDETPELVNLANRVLETEGVNSLWLELIIKIGVNYFNADNGIQNSIDCYEAAINSVDPNLHPREFIDIYVRLAQCYFHSGNTEKTIERLRSAVVLLAKIKAKASIRDRSTLRTTIYLPDHVLSMIPYLLIQHGEIIEAVMSLEMVRFHPVDAFMEDFFCIDSKPNRAAMMFRYSVMRMIECCMPFISAEEQIKEFKNIERLRNQVDSVKNQHSEFTENGFLGNFRLNIKKYDTWVLIPICGLESSKLVLIPPRSNEIHVSDEINFGLKSITQFLTNSDYGLSVVIDSVKKSNDESAKGGANISRAFAVLENFLWEFAGKWLLENCGHIQQYNPIKLSIIAHGPLALLPFSLAQNPEDPGQNLLDMAEISYAPSLYALYALQERAKLVLNDFHVGFVSPEDVHVYFSENSFIMIRGWFVY